MAKANLPSTDDLTKRFGIDRKTSTGSWLGIASYDTFTEALDAYFDADLSTIIRIWDAEKQEAPLTRVPLPDSLGQVSAV